MSPSQDLPSTADVPITGSGFDRRGPFDNVLGETVTQAQIYQCPHAPNVEAGDGYPPCRVVGDARLRPDGTFDTTVTLTAVLPDPQCADTRWRD